MEIFSNGKHIANFAVLLLMFMASSNEGRRSQTTLKSTQLQRQEKGEAIPDDFMPYQYVVEIRERKSGNVEIGRRDKYRSRGYTHIHYRKVERLEQTHLHDEDYEREIYLAGPEVKEETHTKRYYYSPFPTPGFRVNSQFRKWALAPVKISG